MQNIRYIFLLFFLFILPVAVHAQTWKATTNLPFGGTDGAFGFTIGDKIYFGGGSGVKTFYEFDSATAVWKKLADLPATITARAFGVGFNIGSLGYMALGQDGTQSQVKSDLWEYDPAQDKWSKKTDFPGAARDGAFSFVVGGKAYVGGGVDAAAGALGDFYSYDPTMDLWTSLASVPTGPPKYLPNMFFTATFALGNFGYMATGSANGGELTDLYRYDPATDTWTKKAPFPGAARQAATGFSLHGKGYVGLGMANYDPNKVYNDFYSYDPAADKWTKAGNFGGTKLAWAVAAQTPTAAYVGGGWDLANAYSGGWWRFDTVTVAPPPKPGYITLSSALIDFGSHEIGNDSTVAAIVHNPSSKPVIIDSMHITGPDAADFSFTPSTITLPYSLSNGPDSVPFRITFKASSPARIEGAMLKIYFDGLADSSRSAILRGTSTKSTQAVETSLGASEIIVAPNPFHDRTTITLVGARDGIGSIHVYDLLGRVVYSIAHPLTAGQRSMSAFDAKALALPEGVYYLKADIGSESVERKLLFLR